MATGGGEHRDTTGRGETARPPFIPAADWPTNMEIVQRALCRAEGGCPCDEGLEARCVAHLFDTDTALAVVEALAARHRLVSPTITREGDR
jgi:hypothetical protein